MATTAPASSSAGTIDVATLVSQLMAVERRPIDKLNTKISTDQTMISSWGTIKGLVSTLQTAAQGLNTGVQGNSATSSDTSVFSASASSTAAPGTYALNVTALAQAQNLVSVGQISASAAIGTVGDTLTINVGTTAPNNTFSAATTSGSTTVTVSSTTNLAVGAAISGVGIPAGATIASITDANNFVISAAATATGSGVTLQGGVAATFTSNSSTSITLDSSHVSLQGISDAINAANMGVTATIINDGSGTPYRLTLTSNSTGASNSLQVTTTGSAALNTLLAYDPATGGTENLAQTIAAQNAAFTVNGIAITKPSNTVTDAIQGVTLALNKINTPATLTVVHDTTAVSAAVTSFVDAYNALHSQLKSRSAYGTATSVAGELAGDRTIRLMQSQLRDIFNTPATPATGGTLTYLAQIGVVSQADGTLKLDSAALNSAMTKNFSDVTNLLSSATGFATRLNTWATSAVTAGGLIDTKTQGLNTAITSYNSQISQLGARMTILQTQYTTQYSNLNMLLSSMNSTSTYLGSQFKSA